MQIIEGSLQVSHKRFALVVSKCHLEITGKMMNGAIGFLKEQGIDDPAIQVIKVPGAWEIPLAAERAAESNAFDAVICIGAVVLGATHYLDQAALEISRGIAEISRKYHKPVSFGVLMAETLEQVSHLAEERGWGADAASSAMEMAGLLDEIAQFEGHSFLRHMD